MPKHHAVAAAGPLQTIAVTAERRLENIRDDEPRSLAASFRATF